MSNRQWPVSAAVAAMLVLVASGVAEARDRHRDVSARQYTRTTQTQRTDNGFTRKDTVVNAKGKSATRDVAVANDRDAGLRTRNVDYVGPNGRTRSVDASCDTSSKSCTKTVVNNGGGAPAP